MITATSVLSDITTNGGSAFLQVVGISISSLTTIFVALLVFSLNRRAATADRRTAEAEKRSAQASVHVHDLAVTAAQMAASQADATNHHLQDVSAKIGSLQDDLGAATASAQAAYCEANALNTKIAQQGARIDASIARQENPSLTIPALDPAVAKAATDLLVQAAGVASAKMKETAVKDAGTTTSHGEHTHEADHS